MNIEETTNSSNQKRNLKKDIQVQMSKDIQLLLTPFKNKDIGLRILSEKTRVSEKTIVRIKELQTLPHQSTAAKFYEYFFDVKGTEINDSIIHKEIRNFIMSGHPAPLTKYNRNLESILASDKVFREIFLYSRTGKITKKFIKSEYGNYGVDKINLMLAESVLIEESKGIFIAGPISVPKSMDTIKIIIEELVSDNLDSDKLSELGHNKAFYTVEGVSDNSKQDILKLMDEYQAKIMDYMFNEAELGDNRMFVVGVADSLKKKIKLESDNRILQ